MCAQNSKFVPKFPLNGGFTDQNLVFFERKFSDNKKIFQQAKISGGGIAHSLASTMMPLRGSNEIVMHFLELWSMGISTK